MVRQARSLDLAPRATPAQERSRETLAHLLATAATLLDEVGIDGFTTNRLAEAAGVRVRTVYHYFPNKQAVIVALAREIVAEWDAGFADVARLADPEVDWRAGWREQARRFLASVRARPGAGAIRRAMAADPVLREIDQRDNERLAKRLGKALAARGDLPPARARAVARTLIESAVAVLDLMLLSPPARARALGEELERMHFAYLATWLPPPRR